MDADGEATLTLLEVLREAATDDAVRAQLIDVEALTTQVLAKEDSVMGLLAQELGLADLV